MVIAQHMPPMFTTHLARDLSTAGKIRVIEAEDNMRLEPGLAAMAPGGKNLELKIRGPDYKCQLMPASNNPAVPSPSVNALFSSLEKAGSRVLAILLTGLGSDGADGMLRLRQAGAVTLAQDESTSLIYGMPRAAIERGGVDEVVGLPGIAGKIVDYVQGSREKIKCS